MCSKISHMNSRPSFHVKPKLQSRFRVSPVKGSNGEWNLNEGLRAFGTPNPSLSNVAHEGLNWCNPEDLIGLHVGRPQVAPTVDG